MQSLAMIAYHLCLRSFTLSLHHVPLKIRILCVAQQLLDYVVFLEAHVEFAQKFVDNL